MHERFEIRLNGRAFEVSAGWSLSAALARAGFPASRRSVTGSPRGPLCGMGICHECLVTVDGQAHVRACCTPCRPGMEVSLDGPTE
jgi:predicted molibdopterin-dependent oxidoreductase YjgC